MLGIPKSRMLGIPKLRVLMSNELEKLHNMAKLPSYIICNYQDTSLQGTHWCALYKDLSRSHYMDPFGIEIFPEAIDFLENGIYSTFKIQPEGSKICGQLSLFVLYKLSQGKDFDNIILELNSFFITEKWTSAEDQLIKPKHLNCLTIESANHIYVNQSGDIMEGSLDMKNNKIINLQNPTDDKDAVTKIYVRNEINNLENTIENK